MNKVKLTKKYTLILPKYFSRDKLIPILKKVIGMNACFGMGLKDSYSVNIVNKDGKIDTCIDIDTISKKGEYFTTITQTIDGKEEYKKEIYDKEPDIMNSILNEFNGILLVKKYRTVDYCEKTDTLFGINYDQNTLEYSLLNLLMNKTQDPIESMYIHKLIKDNKEEISDILNL